MKPCQKFLWFDLHAYLNNIKRVFIFHLCFVCFGVFPPFFHFSSISIANVHPYAFRVLCLCLSHFVCANVAFIKFEFSFWQCSCFVLLCGFPFWVMIIIILHKNTIEMKSKKTTERILWMYRMTSLLEK